MELIKRNSNGKFAIGKENNRYYLFHMGNEIKMVRSPGGNTVSTLYLPLAERLLEDIEDYGTGYMRSDSVIPWHFTMIDNFSKLKHEQVEQIIKDSFPLEFDWTFGTEDSIFHEAFGMPQCRKGEIYSWLSKCTLMQLTATCCIGNAYESINLAYVLAMLLENYKGIERDRWFEKLAKYISNLDFECSVDETLNTFLTFELYYGIHLEEEGPIINKDISLLDNEPLFVCESITTRDEILIGRNYYYYEAFELDYNRSYELNTDLDLDTPYELDAFDDENLPELIWENCWVKVLRDEEQEDEVYYFIIHEEVDGEITNTAVVSKEVETTKTLFSVPGFEVPQRCSYFEIDSDAYPPVVERELQLLENAIYLPDGFSFIGKRLPQTILDEGGNGGDITEHTFALQSAYRHAYSHISIFTDEAGIIKDLEYSTYQSSGNAYEDMFRRPKLIDDYYKESLEVLLCILEAYTDEEYDELMDQFDLEELECAKDNQHLEPTNPISICLRMLEENAAVGLIDYHGGFPHIPELNMQASLVCSEIIRGVGAYAEENNKLFALCGAWSAYAGIGSVFLWDRNWPELKEKGIIKALSEPRGFDEMDEYVTELMGLDFDGEESRLIRASFEAWGNAFEKGLETRGFCEDTFNSFLQAMYMYGIVYGMSKLGMH